MRLDTSNPLILRLFFFLCVKEILYSKYTYKQQNRQQYELWGLWNDKAQIKQPD